MTFSAEHLDAWWLWVAVYLFAIVPAILVFFGRVARHHADRSEREDGQGSDSKPVTPAPRRRSD